MLSQLNFWAVRQKMVEVSLCVIICTVAQPVISSSPGNEASCQQDYEIRAPHGGSAFVVSWPVDCEDMRPLMPTGYGQFSEWLIGGISWNVWNALRRERGKAYLQLSSQTERVLHEWIARQLEAAEGSIEWCNIGRQRSQGTVDEDLSCAQDVFLLALEQVWGRSGDPHRIIEDAYAYVNDLSNVAQAPTSCEGGHENIISMFFQGRLRHVQVLTGCDAGPIYSYDGQSWVTSRAFENCVLEIPVEEGEALPEFLKHSMQDLSSCRAAMVHPAAASYDHLLPEAVRFLVGTERRSLLQSD